MYEPKNYDHLLGIHGLSDQLMKNHFTLYQGYVTNVNKLADSIAKMVAAGTFTPEFAELKRRFGWEFNGMRMHEIFFRIMSKSAKPIDVNSKFHSKIEKQFGSWDTYVKELKAIATMRGMGWTVTYYDISTDKLINCWVNEHDVGHLATCAPVFCIDVFEHAFMIDYQLKRADYVDAVLKIIDWNEVEKLLHLVGGVK